MTDLGGAPPATPPLAPVITGFSTNSGSPTDTLTNDTTPTLTITAEIDEVAMPRGDIAMTTIEFQNPKRPEIRQVGGYFFLANGATARTSYDVRSLAFNLTDRYAYYCKVQLTKSGTVKGADESLMEPFREDAEDLLTALIPPLMRCLPDWPSWESADGGGGDGAVRDRAAEDSTSK